MMLLQILLLSSLGIALIFIIIESFNDKHLRVCKETDHKGQVTYCIYVKRFGRWKLWYDCGDAYSFRTKEEADNFILEYTSKPTKELL